MKIVEAKSNLPFSEQALAKMLETQEELFIGYNFQDRGILRVGNEAYADTAWYVSKEGNSYFLSSWLEGDDGEGPEDGTVEEFKTTKELYAAIQNLEPLTDMPALQEAASEEKEYRSEYQKLKSTPEGREQLKNMPWEKRKELYDADRAVDPVDQILSKLPDYDLEYEGYDYEWYRDKWNYNTMNHDQDYGTDHYDDFTYSVDATSLFETVFDILQEKVSGPVTDKLMIECKKLMQAWWQVSNDVDKEAEPLEAVELFVAQNLEYFADMCYEELLAEYKDQAYEGKPARADEDLQPNAAKEFKEYETMWEN